MHTMDHERGQSERVTLAVHPVTFAHIQGLRAMECAVLNNIVRWEKFDDVRYLRMARKWMKTLIQGAYPSRPDSAPPGWADGGPPIKMIQGAADIFCTANELSDEAFIVISSLVLHRSDVTGNELLINAYQTLDELLSVANAATQPQDGGGNGPKCPDNGFAE